MNVLYVLIGLVLGVVLWVIGSYNKLVTLKTRVRESLAELNCVSTNILPIPLFKQFEIGISTKRYFPAIGTAGLLLLAVRGYNLEPAPPPSITDNISRE